MATSREWDRREWVKQRNPSGEVIRTKTYWRGLPVSSCLPIRSIVAQRKKLAKMLQIHAPDLMCDLEITVKCNRYPRNRRLPNPIPKPERYD